MQLVDAGEDAAARAAQRAWAVLRRRGRRRSARRSSSTPWTRCAPRRATLPTSSAGPCAPDPAARCSLLRAGRLLDHPGRTPAGDRRWSTGRGRAHGWEPPPDLRRRPGTAAGADRHHTGGRQSRPHSDPVAGRWTATARGQHAVDRRDGHHVARPSARPAAGLRRAARPDRRLPDRRSPLALPWPRQARENIGDPEVRSPRGTEALAAGRGRDGGPWPQAMMHAMSAALRAARPRRGGSPRASRVPGPGPARCRRRPRSRCARWWRSMVAGRPRGRRAPLAVARSATRRVGLAGRPSSVARRRAGPGPGRIGEGLGFRAAGLRVGELPFPGVGDPAWCRGRWWPRRRAWRHTPATAPATSGADLFEALTGKRAGARPGPALPDYPVCGLVLFALGPWGLLRDALPVEVAVRLIALADRFGYSRSSHLAWSARRPCRGAAPGRWPDGPPSTATARGPDLLDEARGVIADGSGLSSELPAVAPHRERREDRDDRGAADERPPDCSVTSPAFIRSRVALTTNVTGLTSTNSCSQSGMVSFGTNAGDRKVSGNMIIMQALHALRSSAHRAEPGEHPASDQPAKIVSTIATTHRPPRHRAGSPSAGRPRRSASPRSRNGAGQRPRTGQRRDPGHRQRLEPVEHPLVHVLAQLRAASHEAVSAVWAGCRG